MLEITKEAFLEWEAHPVTQALREGLLLQVKQVKDRWAEGAYLKNTAQETVVNEIGVMGRISAYKALVDMDFEELQGILHE